MSYSKSHLERGSTYDETIHGSPFDDYMARWEKVHLRSLVRKLFGSDLERYLDFACGTGRITEAVAPMAANSFGVDISESMAGQARAKCPDTEFLIGDFTQAPPDIEPVDLVTSFRFFGNAEDDLRHRALVTINKVLKTGGYFIANNHRNPNALPTLLHKLTGGKDDMTLSHNHAKKLLASAGFRVTETRCIGLWVFRHAMSTDKVLNSNFGKVLERYLHVPGEAHICPDVILVAQKMADAEA